jgi:hypothetical protein
VSVWQAYDPSRLSKNPVTNEEVGGLLFFVEIPDLVSGSGDRLQLLCGGGNSGRADSDDFSVDDTMARQLPSVALGRSRVLANR